ncbi:hypothetical protein AN944_00282 [Shewanella sp. P1-14-1]|uniref:hypothetical protein n=1 Tax=Shewanella sp. P1-14-1 TaxID=1723761 RepID=UPI0006E5B8C0|nr:hypothetical protein [Shewanella sp. P1-14-1]KPZ73134.1 hypothetical protein AN944_00282 [Shewanella sp. P1-14-1]
MKPWMMKLIFFVFVGLPFSTSAAFNCSVDVSRVLIYGNGSVNILHTGRGDYTNICNLNNDWKGVNVTTCAMWTGMLQSIKQNNGKAIFYYGGEGSCSTLPTYGVAPAPVYIGQI